VEADEVQERAPRLLSGEAAVLPRGPDYFTTVINAAHQTVVDPVAQADGKSGEPGRRG
jgi:hypothetical protein